MQDIRICDNCGACYLNNGEHECDVKPDRESDDWYIDQQNDSMFAEYCKVESVYRGPGMWQFNVGSK